MTPIKTLRGVANNTKTILKMCEKLTDPNLNETHRGVLTKGIYEIVMIDLAELELLTDVAILGFSDYRKHGLVSLALTRTALLLEAARRHT